RPAVRRPASAPRRLPNVVPAPRRSRARTLVPEVARSPAARSRGGRAALRARPVSDDAAAPPARRRLSLPLHRRGEAAGGRRVVQTRAGGDDAAGRRVMAGVARSGRQRPSLSTRRRGGGPARPVLWVDLIAGCPPPATISGRSARTTRRQASASAA